MAFGAVPSARQGNTQLAHVLISSIAYGLNGLYAFLVILGETWHLHLPCISCLPRFGMWETKPVIYSNACLLAQNFADGGPRHHPAEMFVIDAAFYIRFDLCCRTG